MAVENICGKILKITTKKEKLNFKKNQIYEIEVYVILFVLFLSLNEDNISNSLKAIFLSY